MRWKKRWTGRQRTFEKRKPTSPKWYDVFEDWPLIEASFTIQYGIRLREEPEMSWSEFSNLLQGILPETPLGQMVSIRSEENKEILKHFTPEQHRIRNDWRAGYSQISAMTDREKERDNANIQEMLRQAFG